MLQLLHPYTMGPNNFLTSTFKTIFPHQGFHEFYEIICKLRYCEKATKFEKFSHLFWRLLSNVRRRFFQNFVAFPENLNFKVCSYLKQCIERSLFDKNFSTSQLMSAWIHTIFCCFNYERTLSNHKKGIYVSCEIAGA